MKKLPYLNEIGRNAIAIDTFAGLNKGFRIPENELSESYNMTSADYPVLSSREKRKIMTDSLIRGGTSGLSSVVSSDGFLYYLLNKGDLYCENNENIPLNVKNNKLIRIGNMLYVYPSGKLVKLPSSEDGEITVEDSIKKLSFPVDENSGAYIINFNPARLSAADGKMSYVVVPSDPEVGDYFWSTSTGLQFYGDTGSGEMGWISTEPDSIMVQATTTVDGKPVYFDFSSCFKVNDAIFISNLTDIYGESVKSFESSYVIDCFGSDKYGNSAMFLKGGGNNYASVISAIFEKKMPYGLDYVIEHNNRLWGCYYGLDAQGNFINEIYATAQNDPTNWYRYDGTVSQSYTMSVTSDGPFTGAAVINGYPTFFKEDCMHRIYGDSPSDYQLVTYKCAGVQKGSELSLASFNGTYFYKSNIGIMQISDGYPVKISEALGNDMYSDAIGGTDGSFYYVAMKDRYGDYTMFVYDLKTCIWHCEDSPANLTMFFNFGSRLFAVCELHSYDEKLEEYYNLYLNAKTSWEKTMYYAYYVLAKAAVNCDISIICFSKSNLEDITFPAVCDVDCSPREEDDIRWHFETGDIGYSYYYTKYVEKLCVRLQADVYARVDIEILYDSQGEWVSLEHITGDDTVKMHSIELRPQRCDHFKLRFSGIGGMKLVNITEIFSDGSELQ